MKRNTNLAVTLLLLLEQVEDAEGLARHQLKESLGQSKHASSMTSEELWDVLDYHLRLLQSAGFVTITQSFEGVAHDDVELTWSGHDYLDVNRPSESFNVNVKWP
ncbi:DUF2513 domain-containing protein [Pseudomonas peradeniyensis]|uniref:DUF2513 domain-containing protein n=1 Tax=Pseudomonas peradeniyensis TaxID=2745488 RepID=A0ABT2VF81_9PSED|nr:DUF2513 domain-containing protein [Pseudomonas peradeniyensis]MCU7240394.1 DUF2513 domain-containing protein [Pseudomonas peradeniyensis]